MRQFIGDEFDAVISGVASFGFWAETIEHKCEGLVSVQSLLDYDDFRHVDTEYALVGKRSGRAFRMGDKVRIKLIAANLAKRQLDYEWVLHVDDTDDISTPGESKPRKAKRKK
jgi:ribonuclease R